MNSENKDKVFEVKVVKVKEWFNSAEAAEFLGISEASLRNMVTLRKIIPYKLGRRNRYKFEDVRNLIEPQRIGAYYGN